MYRECVNNHRDERGRERERPERERRLPARRAHPPGGRNWSNVLPHPPSTPPLHATILPDSPSPHHPPPPLHCGQCDTSCQTRFLGLRFMCFLRFLPSLELLRVIGPVQALATWRRYELDRQIPLRYPTLDEAFLIPPKVLVHGSGTGGSPALFG